jgi:hypothetical protein
MEGEIRRLRSWKIVGSLLLLLAVIAVSFWAWVLAAADRRWAYIERQVRETMAAADHRGGPRPTIAPNPAPGDAWDEYRLALSKIEMIRASDEHLWKLLEKPGVSKEIPLWAELAKMAPPALTHLGNGVRMAEARPTISWEFNGFGSHGPSEKLVKLGMVALCMARVETSSGNTDRAVDRILEVMMFGRDVADINDRDSVSSGMFLLIKAADELRALLQSRALPHGALLAIQRALEVVEQGLPREGSDLRNTVAQLVGQRFRGHSLFEAFDRIKLGAVGPVRAGWRSCFSTRLHEAEAVERWFEVVSIHEKGLPRSWKQARELEGVSQRMLYRSPGNGIAEQFIMFVNDFSLHRETITRLRLLRMAARYLADGAMTMLEDPFGDQMKYSADESCHKMYSVGINGADDGGTGTWSGWCPDIVLELKR